MRDQSHLKLSVDVQSDYRSGPMYVLKAVNQGRRPVVILYAYARVSSGKTYPVFDTRTTLNETNSLEFTVPFSGFFKTLSSGCYIRAFEFEDSTGKHYVIKTNRLRREVADMLRKEHPA